MRKPTRGARHKLFAQQRAAAALDQVEARVDLVGAVDGEVQQRAPAGAVARVAAGDDPAGSIPPASSGRRA